MRRRLIHTASSAAAKAAAARIAARQPKPTGAQVWYRPAVAVTLFDRVLGRWRGEPIDLNFDHATWASATTASRHVGHWSTLMTDATFTRLLWPDLCVVSGIASSIVAYNVTCTPAEPVMKHGFNLLLHHNMVTLPPEPLTLSAFALGLLVTFRTNQSYGRYDEGRQLWGQLNNVLRSAASRLVASAPASHEHAAAQLRAVRLLAAFAHCLKYHLTVDGCNASLPREGELEAGERVPLARAAAAAEDALRDELLVLFGDEGGADIEPILAAPNRPLHAAHELGVLIRSGALQLDSVSACALEERLRGLLDVLGGCERLLRTPIYTPYTQHTSRFLFAWCCALPAALFPIVGPAGTVPISVALSFFMLGIEDIGARLEMPFDVLPLWQYTAVIDASCEQVVRQSAGAFVESPRRPRSGPLARRGQRRG